MQQQADRILTWRGGVVENSHMIHAAVVDSAQNLLSTVGNVNRLTLARSAAKPFQALAILETGAAEKFSPADIALMCSSHNAETRHVFRAMDMLQRVDSEEQDLRCGGHASLSQKVNDSWSAAGFVPTAMYNNCCAKHVGMLAAAKAIGAGTEGYNDVDHPVQQRFKSVIEELSAFNADGIFWGIDGCNAPAPAMPLDRMACMYAALADAADQNERRVTSPLLRNERLSTIYQAMSTYPEMLAGEARFCTDLGRTYSGALVGKLGADGCYGVAVKESDSTRRIGAKGAVGIAVKVEDGRIDILYAAVLEILKQLHLGSIAIQEKLHEYHSIKLKNTMGIVTGKLSFVMKVQSVQDNLATKDLR